MRHTPVYAAFVIGKSAAVPIKPAVQTLNKRLCLQRVACRNGMGKVWSKIL